MLLEIVNCVTYAEEGLDFSVDSRTVTLSPCSGSGCNTHIFDSISIAPDRILESSEMFNVSFDASSLSLPGAILNFGQPTTIEIRGENRGLGCLCKRSNFICVCMS